MSDQRRTYKDVVTAYSSPYGNGDIEASFEAERFEGLPLLDTRVEVTIQAFSIIWANRHSLVEEINAVIKKYSI